jgi:putative ABC transport system substrate-binding protein
MDIRWLGSDPQRIQSETADLIARRPEVIFSGTSVAIAQILRTSSIAIVFAGITDPVSQGFVKSLPRPDSNATGFAAYEESLGGKWIETLKELWPSLRRAAVLYEPTTAPYMPGIFRSIETAAPTYGVAVTDVQGAQHQRVGRRTVDVRPAAEHRCDRSGSGLHQHPFRAGDRACS